MDRKEHIEQLIKKFSAAFMKGKETGVPMAWRLHDEVHDALEVAQVTDLEIIPDVIAAVDDDPEVLNDIDAIVANYKEAHPGESKAYIHLIAVVGG